MTEPVKLETLEVLGYAEVLLDGALPCVVPPIFRLKRNVERVFLPPYTLKGSFLWNATEVRLSELIELRDARQVTLFDPTFDAHDDHEMWIDQAFQVHYQPTVQANLELEQIADQALSDAERALSSGELCEAERFSGIAISANDRNVTPLIIKAAIRRLQKNEAGVRLMARLAARTIKPQHFEKLVNGYIDRSEIPRDSAPPARRLAQSSMEGMAREKLAA